MCSNAKRESDWFYNAMYNAVYNVMYDVMTMA